jgi:hypothetical protein
LILSGDSGRINLMKWTLILLMSLCGLTLGQVRPRASLADPNLAKSDPNTTAFITPSDPNTTAMSVPKPLAGTLGMNWLYQGKKPPQPLVGQEDVTFRIERYPWPYIGYNRDNNFAGPWFYDPWYGHGYWRYYSNDYWRHHPDHHDGWWYNDAYTYPLNYVQMQIKLNENTSFNLGVSFTSDPVPWP